MTTLTLNGMRFDAAEVIATGGPLNVKTSRGELRANSGDVVVTILGDTVVLSAEAAAFLERKAAEIAEREKDLGVDDVEASDQSEPTLGQLQESDAKKSHGSQTSKAIKK